MDKKKILLINLSKGRLGELNSSLIGLILVGKLLIASLSRTDIPEATRSDFYFYIDEFQNVTTPSIATILSEARKYRLDLIISHQFIGQLEENIKKAVFGNVGSMVSFRIGSEDGEFLEKQFMPVFNAHDLINIDNYNCYVKLLINGQTSEPFNMKTAYLQKQESVLIEKIKELSRVKYGRPREDIEAEILKKHM
ncbi:MAG: type IV secretory system conjugative DNA transfer family protein, partial [Candidatus Sungbacteria bacterium]|nr:type IV secretory system conjugative DNA transfer family protein [Candidatus Sungbacteria bacterium]